MIIYECKCPQSLEGVNFSKTRVTGGYKPPNVSNRN